jgi:hypothetical protein
VTPEPAATPEAKAPAAAAPAEVKAPVQEDKPKADKDAAPSVSAPTSGTSREMDTALEDALLAELGGAPAPASPVPPRSEPAMSAAPSQPATKTEPATDTTVTGQEDTSPSSATETPEEPIKGSAAPSAEPEKKAEGPADAKDGSMDAIEEEMARLLNEINGSRKS